MPDVGRAFVKVLALLYGFITWVCFALMALKDGKMFQKPSAIAVERLRNAQDRLWNTLGGSGYEHCFFTTSDGVRLHYVISAPCGNLNDNANIIIFIHGFPDSWALWRYFLQSQRLRQKATLIAVDLPGYGGSDGLETYDATSVLNTLTSFIIGMKDNYLTDGGRFEVSGENGGKTLIVSHDWGAIVAYRLAAEAPQLADRFIMINSILPNLARANIFNYWSSTYQILKAWTRAPLALNLLSAAAVKSYPILRQCLLSGYIFVFNIPLTFPHSLSYFGDNWLLRKVHEQAADKSLPENSDEAAEALASSLGPAPEQCGQSQYSASVYQRAQGKPMTEQVRYYREGLAFEKWKLSNKVITDLKKLERDKPHLEAYTGTDSISRRPVGALQAKSTILWGLRDVALDMRITLTGIEDYLTEHSHVIVAPQIGHWLPLNDMGMKLLENSVDWVLSAQDAALSKRMAETGLSVDVLLEK